MYLEQQEDDAALRNTIDTAITMIAEEQPEQLRQFSHWINRMFRGSLENDDIDKVNQLTEVKTMLAEVVDKIEERGEHRGMHQARREDAKKMLDRGFSVKDIAEITGLTEQEIREL